jgi:predicted component of type VI protein secretion system
MNICLTFDTNKIDGSSYGGTAWFTFWSAIREKELGVGTRLYCGDLLTINPSFYGILVETDNPSVLTEIKRRYSSNDAFKKICGSNPFIEGASAASIRLVNAGTIDSRYVLVGGESDWARVELSSVKLPELGKVYAKDAEVATPPRPKPASPRTSTLQVIADMSALKETLKSKFPTERDFVSLLPEEVCDLADACNGHFFVAWELSGIVYTESFVKIYFMEKAGELKAFRLQGFFNFPSVADIDRFIREYVGYSRGFLNITEATALNFIGPKDMKFNDRGKEWMSKENLSGDLLWKYIHLRKIQLGLISGQASNAVSPPRATGGITPPPGANEPVVQLLAEAKGILDGVDQELLVDAAKAGSTGVVQALLKKGANVNAANRNGATALMAASAKDHAGTVKFLLEGGADANAADKNGVTSLMLSSYGLKDMREVVKLLLAAGANVNAAEDRGSTPLYMASQQGHIETVKLLLAAGANVNTADKKGATPLFQACLLGHTETVKLLLAAGANINVTALGQFTPLMIASQAGHANIVQLLKASEAGSSASPPSPSIRSTISEGRTTPSKDVCVTNQRKWWQLWK